MERVRVKDLPELIRTRFRDDPSRYDIYMLRRILTLDCPCSDDEAIDWWRRVCKMAKYKRQPQPK